MDLGGFASGPGVPAPSTAGRFRSSSLAAQALIGGYARIQQYKVSAPQTGTRAPQLPSLGGQPVVIWSQAHDGYVNGQRLAARPLRLRAAAPADVQSQRRPGTTEALPMLRSSLTGRPFASARTATAPSGSMRSGFGAQTRVVLQKVGLSHTAIPSLNAISARW